MESQVVLCARSTLSKLPSKPMKMPLMSAWYFKSNRPERDGFLLRKMSRVYLACKVTVITSARRSTLFSIFDSIGSTFVGTKVVFCVCRHSARPVPRLVSRIFMGYFLISYFTLGKMLLL